MFWRKRHTRFYHPCEDIPERYFQKIQTEAMADLILPELPTDSTDDLLSAKGPQVPCSICSKQCTFSVYSNEDRSIVIGKCSCNQLTTVQQMNLPGLAQYAQQPLYQPTEVPLNYIVSELPVVGNVHPVPVAQHSQQEPTPYVSFHQQPRQVTEEVAQLYTQAGLQQQQQLNPMVISNQLTTAQQINLPGFAQYAQQPLYQTDVANVQPVPVAQHSNKNQLLTWHSISSRDKRTKVRIKRRKRLPSSMPSQLQTSSSTT